MILCAQKLGHIRRDTKAHFQVYSVQPKVSIRVDGATELSTEISQSEAAAANVRVMPERKFVADWPP